MRSGDDLLYAGDIDGALAAFTPRSGEADWEPALAWRIGLIHYLLRGSPREALPYLVRGHLTGEDTADEALLLGWLASAYWALGEVESCDGHAVRAFRAARACGDDRALAGAHVALALRAMLTGDRMGNAAHYAKALRHAEAARDSLQLIRIRMNRASHYLDEACLPEALEDLRLAVGEADRIGNSVLLALALTNEGDALCQLGRLVEAGDRFRRAIELYQQAGSSKVCFALLGLGHVHRRRDQPALARAAYEEAISLAERDGHRQVLVPALAGLAMVLADIDSAQALALAKRARAEAVGPFVTVTLLALARAELAAGNRMRGAELAEDAQCSARAHRDRAGIAQALELQAESLDDWSRARPLLAEARSIWRDAGADVDADRVTVALGRLPVVTAEAFSDAAIAAQRLAGAGISTGSRPATPVIHTLGRFEVLLAGKPIPPSVWQSRKARDLLRLLVARRGRAVAREELIEQLWPEPSGPGSERRAHRLTVALSIVRSVLDGTRTGESAIIAEGGSVALDVGRMVIDVETFMRQADHGLRAHRDGHAEESRSVLVAAERLYTGDFLEDEPYDDWAAMTREQARATYLRVGRILADGALRCGDTDEAIHYLLRLLALDGYDEQCHHDLIEAYTAAGRHGEARRARDRYLNAMRQIGVDAAGIRGRG